jgi:ribonuclease Z
MRVQFIGVGEAFDERYPNTSVLVSFGGPDSERHVLLDCGFTAAAAYYTHAAVGADLDAVWISHFHGDHFLGLPLLLLRFWEEGRTKPLAVVGQAGVEEKLWSAFELAYPGFRPRLRYPVQCFEAASGKRLDLLGVQCSFALNEHNASAPCLAIRLDEASTSLFYSGDGRPTQDTENLARGVDLLIHEAYGMDSNTSGHGGVSGCLELARSVGARTLALVHVNRRVRREQAGSIRDDLFREFASHGLLPEPGDRIAL